ncbi:hypothetical protein MKX03_009688 [Papaver bracteatum]|nr:hypothetical protein MKX03_009688 [Papaver bracteatum]
MTKRSKSGKRKKIYEKDLVCLIGFYLFCVLFFGDINANGVNVKYLSIVETYESVLKILFAEHAPEGSIPKVANHEEDIPRVGRWDLYQISDYISITYMTQFSLHIQLKICIFRMFKCFCYLFLTSPSPSFVAEFSQHEKQLGISTVVPSKDDLQSWLKAQTIENGQLKEQLQANQAMFKAVYAIAREGISEGDLSGTA